MAEVSSALIGHCQGAKTLQCSFRIIAVRAWCSICDWRMTAERTSTRWPLLFPGKNRCFRTGVGQMAIGAVTMSGPAKMAQTVFDFGWG